MVDPAHPAPPAAGIEAILVDARQAAAACGFSLRSWRSLDAAAAIPRAVRPGGGRVKRWRMTDLRAWSAAGCPDRREFEMEGGK